MNMALQIFCCLIAAEFAYIFYLETVIPDSGTTAKVFGMDVKDLKMPAMKTAMKNQGVYNLGIAVFLILAAFVLHSKYAVAGLLAYIVCVALYGSFTVSKTIILKQGGLAIISLILCFFRAVLQLMRNNAGIYGYIAGYIEDKR